MRRSRAASFVVPALALALLVPALAVPDGATASGMRFDYNIWLSARGAPEPGVPFQVVATARADLGGQVDVRLAVPAHVRIEGDPTWREELPARAVTERVWTLVATQEGLWSARLIEGDGEGAERTRACCVYARTFEGHSRAGGPLDALQSVDVRDALRREATGPSTVRLTYEVVPKWAWGEEFGFVLAFSDEPDTRWTEFAPGAPAAIHRNVSLADGASVEVPLRVQALASFETHVSHEEGPERVRIPVQCVRAVLERSGDEVAWNATKPCFPGSTPGESPRSFSRFVPAPSPLVAVALAALGAAVVAGVRRR